MRRGPNSPPSRGWRDDMRRGPISPPSDEVSFADVRKRLRSAPLTGCTPSAARGCSPRPARGDPRPALVGSGGPRPSSPPRSANASPPARTRGLRQSGCRGLRPLLFFRLARCFLSMSWCLSRLAREPNEGLASAVKQPSARETLTTDIDRKRKVSLAAR